MAVLLVLRVAVRVPLPGSVVWSAWGCRRGRPAVVVPTERVRTPASRKPVTGKVPTPPTAMVPLMAPSAVCPMMVRRGGAGVGAVDDAVGAADGGAGRGVEDAAGEGAGVGGDDGGLVAGGRGGADDGAGGGAGVAGGGGGALEGGWMVPLASPPLASAKKLPPRLACPLEMVPVKVPAPALVLPAVVPLPTVTRVKLEPLEVAVEVEGADAGDQERAGEAAVGGLVGDVEGDGALVLAVDDAVDAADGDAGGLVEDATGEQARVLAGDVGGGGRGGRRRRGGRRGGGGGRRGRGADQLELGQLHRAAAGGER